MIIFVENYIRILPQSAVETIRGFLIGDHIQPMSQLCQTPRESNMKKKSSPKVPSEKDLNVVILSKFIQQDSR